MNEDIRKAYKEIFVILQFVSNEFIEKLPKKFIEFIEREKDNEYLPNISPDIPLENQHLLSDTLNILAILKLNYWCKDKNEKQELLDILKENEKQYQKELHEKYNINFNRKKEKKYQTENNSETALLPIKEKNFIHQILIKIMMLFKKPL